MASRPEDPVAAAAKVIRIIHDNHAAQSRYLHALKVTPGESHPETKTILQCMEQEEYLDLLTDLEPPQKTAFFDKVAGTGEKPSENPSTLEKETIKLYFEALGLEAKGLSLKTVSAEVKKRPTVTASAPPTSTTTPALPSTPLTSKPYREEEIEVKELNLKDKPAQKAVKPTLPAAQKAPVASAPKSQKEKKENKGKQEKKRKREDDAPKVSKKPKTEPEAPVGGSSKRQRRREKQKTLLEKVAAGEVPAVSKPAVKGASETEKVVPVAPSSASKEQASVDQDMQLKGSEPTTVENSEPAALESVVPANPKSKKVRRSKHRSEKGKSKPVETEQPIQPSALDPPIIGETENAAPIDGTKKSRRRARKAKTAEPPVTVPAPVASSSPVQEPALIEEPAITEDASSSSSDEDDLDENLPAKESTMSDFIRRTTLPVLGKPTISATVDSSSDNEDEQDNVSPNSEPMEAIKPEVTAGTLDDKSDPKAVIDRIQREPSSEAIREESPSPTTRETSVSSEEQVPSPPRQQEQKKSSPVVQKAALPKPVSSSFVSAPAQPTLQRPKILSSFSKPQSSFTSTRSASFQSAKPKKSATDAFAEFAAFAAGKKLGYDSSDDDDDSSSSSSSDSDDEKPAPIPVRKPSPVRRQPSPVRPISPIVPVGPEPESEPESEPQSEPESEPESEPTAMDIDTEVGATQEQADPVIPAIDCVMTEDQHDTSSPVEYNDSQSSTQEEVEKIAEVAKDKNSPAFQSFHESTLSQDAPTRTPLPDIPSAEDLMEFGGYQPSRIENTDQVAAVIAEDQAQTSEPATRENHEGPELTEPSNSIEPIVEVEAGTNDKALEDESEADEQASSSKADERIRGLYSEEPVEEPNEQNDVEIEEIAQSSDSDSAEEPAEDQPISGAIEETNEPGNDIAEAGDSAQFSDSEPQPEEADERASSSSGDKQVPEVTATPNEAENEIAETEDIPRPSNSDLELEEPVEAFSNSMQDFLVVWEEETDNFENRIRELRQLLVDDGDGSPEDNKDILEKLMKEVDREETIYKSKTTAARNGLGELEQLARIKILEVLDRADSIFEQRLMMVKGRLREEHNAESARGQLSPDVEDPDVEMKDEPDANAEVEEVESPAKSASPAPSSLGWAPSEDEGLTESAKKEKKPKARKPRKSTGTTSEHFTPSPKRKRVPAGTSAVPFPKLSAPRFGLIQERLATDPFRLLIAVTFLNKTHGKAARPIFEQVMETYPTPNDLAAADASELSEMIHSLGFQNQRARKLIKIAETWVSEPPQKGKLFRTMDYPNKGNGRHLKPKDTVDEDVEDCIEAGALEIAHIYGLGPYAWDSWRIFCRDVFRGVAQGYNGEGVSGYTPLSQTTHTSDFEPEWKRVVPLDKELRACLRWMWLREGWEWDPLTGNKKKAAPALMREASDGTATWDEPVAADPHGESTTAIKHELEGPKGPDALVPGVKAEDVAPAPAPKRRTRRGRNSTGAAAKKRATTPPPAPAPKEAATPIVPASAKRLNADPEIMTSRLRPRAGRVDAIASAPVPPTPSRRRAARK